MIDIRDLGAAPENFERDFDVAAPVRPHSPFGAVVPGHATLLGRRAW